MKKFKNYLMLISLLIIPNIVLASTNNTISLYEAVFYEAFTTIFATLFVLKPLSKLFSETEKPEFYNTRGGKPVSLGNMEINTYTESFIIAN